MHKYLNEYSIANLYSRQGHIENEIDMSLTQSCSGTCPDFKVSKINSCYEDRVRIS